MGPLRVVVIEDDPRYRDGLATLFSHSPGFRLAAAFGAPKAAFDALTAALARGAAPEWDLVLMDIELPGMNGIEATRRLKQAVPGVMVVQLTVFEEPSVILEAICAGADGYLLKKTPAGELLAQLRSVAAGGVPLTAGVARSVLDFVRRTGPQQAARPVPPDPARLDLSDREQEVLRALVEGASYRQVAEQLGISHDTVRSHIRAVYRKLQVHTVAAAVSKAVRQRLV